MCSYSGQFNHTAEKHRLRISCLGREWPDWCQELRLTGDELHWKFTSDGSVNGWGWRFTVFPIMASIAPLDMLSDRTVLSRPSIATIMCLLDFKLPMANDRNIVARLAAALAACAQLSSLGNYHCLCSHLWVSIIIVSEVVQLVTAAT